MSLGQPAAMCLIVLLSSNVVALELVSLRDDGPRITERPNDEVIGGYTGQSLSADGRYLVVQSRATNLVAEQSATDVDQIYVYDFLLQKYERVSVTVTGQPGSSASWLPTISADGRVVLFSTRAINLLGAVPPGNHSQLVSKDLVTGDIQIISRSPVGEFSESHLWWPKPSAKGRWVAFHTSARNLIANDDAALTEVYLHDRLTATTRRLTSSSVDSLHSSNIQDISDRGDYVLFSSTSPAHYEGDSEDSTVLTSSDLFRLKVSDGTVVPVTTHSLSPDRSFTRFGLFLGDENEVTYEIWTPSSGLAPQAWYKNMRTGESRLLSRDENGNPSRFQASIAVLGDDSDTMLLAAASTSFLDGIQPTPFSVFSGSGSGGGAPTFLAPTTTPEGIPLEAVVGISLSSDGQRGVFNSVYRLNAQTLDSDLANVVEFDGTTGSISQVPAPAREVGNGNGASFSLGRSALSFDGRYVSFETSDHTLVPNSNKFIDHALRRDRLLGRTERIGSRADGLPWSGQASSPMLSADGRYAIFTSFDEDLLDGRGIDVRGRSGIYRYDFSTGQTELASRAADGSVVNDTSYGGEMAISGDGQTVAFVSRDRLFPEQPMVPFRPQKYLYVFDFRTKVLEWIDRPPFDENEEVLLDYSGRRLAFNGIGQVYIYDRTTRALELVSRNVEGQPAEGYSHFPALSGNGRFVSFASQSSDLVAGVSDEHQQIYLWDSQTGQVTLVSRNEAGLAGNATSYRSVMDHAGHRVVFESHADNLSANDTNGLLDVFMRDRQFDSMTKISNGTAGIRSKRGAFFPGISGDGKHIIFSSTSNHLAPNDGSPFDDVFLYSVEEPALLSAVLPSSRVAPVGDTVTVYASVISTDQPLQNCTTESPLAGIEIDFRRTNPANNQPIGVTNVPFSLEASVPQSLVLTITASREFEQVDLAISFRCDDGQQARVIPGVNTLQFRASGLPSADIIALSATQSGDGVVSATPDTFGFFSVATFNLGEAGPITARPVAIGFATSELLICQTELATGDCLSDPDEEVSFESATESTATFSVFLRPEYTPEFLPAVNRVALEFSDASGFRVGGTSVAVK